MAELAEPTEVRFRGATEPSARPSYVVECVLAAASLALVLVAVVPDAGGLAATAAVLGVALPAGLGVLRLARHGEDRFARLLVGTGALWSLASLAQSSDATLYSAGRTAAWVYEPAVVYLVLSFPSGQLTSPTSRRLAAATAALTAALYLPTALLAPFPEPSPWATCGTDCPGNVLMLTDASGVVAVVQPLRELLTMLLYAAVGWALVTRARHAGVLLRHAVIPVAAIATVRAAILILYLGTRAATESGLAEVLGWVYLLSLPAVTLAFGLGLLGQRLFAARALEALTSGLRPHAGAAELRRAMSQALRDPSLEILYWAEGQPGRWVDGAGWPTSLPEPDADRAVTEIASDGRRFAAIVHDPELARDRSLIEAAAAYALTALENDRLTRRLSGSLQELRDSRARIVASADAERRRIERDLHDGAQQRLVALRIQLGLFAEELPDDSAEIADHLHVLEHEVDATIDDVRSFARDLYPPLLVERGLADALRVAARSASIPTTIDVPTLRRYSLEIESTVYFACAEALQNAAKHSGAQRARVTVSANGHLRFEVRDDGAGFSPSAARRGAGLTNMGDRLAAVEGTLEVDSAPGRGTRVTGVIPTP